MGKGYIQYKGLIFLFVFVLGLTVSFAQTVIIPAANTNGTGGSTTTGRKPYGNYWGYERSSLIYTSAEIGITGLITDVAFYLNNSFSPASTPVKIYLKEVANANFPATTTVATEESGATLVYNGTIPASAFVNGTWVNVTLTTPFNYTGANNLKIVIETNGGGIGIEDLDAKSFRYTSTNPDYRFQYWQTDNSPPTGNGTRSYYRPNVKLQITPAVACTAPVNAGSTVSTNASVCPSTPFTLSLSGADIASGLSYQWESSPDGVTWTPIIGATSSSYSASQTADTYYHAIVTCSGVPSTSSDLLVTTNAFMSCYCTSAANNTADDDIGNVTFAGINNGSATPSMSNATSVNTYSDFTGLAPANVTKNQTYPISISQINSSGSFWTCWASVFIDYNQDGIFDNTTERVFNAQTSSGAGMTVSGNITIPSTALTGVTGMRVILVEFGSATSPSCGNYGYGETEDYLVNIAPQPLCTAPVNAGSTAASDTSVCPSTIFMLSLSGADIGSGISYQWESSPDGVTWTPISGANSSFLSTSQTTDTYYQAILTCSGVPSASSSLLVTTNGFMSCYCVSSATSTADDDIGNVTFAGINNGSATPATNNPSSVNTYSDFTGIPAANVTKNQTYSISVSQINSGSFYTSWVNVFIDYNQDGLFDNTTERVFDAQTASGAGMTVSGSITIPPTALTGITGMRVVLRESGSATSPSCGTYSWGETEDYLVNIAPQPALDLGVSALVNPTAGDCHTSAEKVRYRIMNYGSATVDFSVNPVTLSGSVSGVNPVSFPSLVISSGTLASNATLDTILSNSYDMTSVGSYTFYGYTSVVGDGMAINDSMDPVTISILPGSAFASNDTLCLGESTQLLAFSSSTTNNFAYIGTASTHGTSYPAPFGNLFWGAKHQMLITAAELTAQGLSAGPIVSLALNVFSPNGSDPLSNFEIKMGHTSNTSMTTFESGLTSYSLTTSYNIIAGWNNFNFSTPFVWDGVSNVIVETCFNNNGWDSNADMYYSVTPFTSTVYYRADASGVCSSNIINSTSNSRPNIRLGSVIGKVYSWSPGITLDDSTIFNPIATPLTTTDYIVTITEASTGCSRTDTVKIVVEPLPVVDLGNDTSICIGTNIVLDAGSGGSVLWSNGLTSQTITVSTAGTYFVTKSNLAGCSVADTINIGINPLPVVNLGTDTTRCGGSVTLDAGNPGSSYAWNGVSGSQQFTVSASGVYIAEVTSAFGCVNSDTINVTINPIPVIGLRNDTAICFGTSIILDANNAGSSFDWSTGEITQTITVDTAGTYYVEVTSPQGCVNVDTFNLVVNPLPVVSLGADTTFCLADSLVLDPGVGYTSYLWNDGSVNQTLTIGASGSYHVTVSNGFNCYNTDTINVVANPLPVTDAGADQTICEGQGVQLTSTGGPTFIWNNGSTTPSIFVTPTDTTMYIVTSTNNLQCSTTDTVMVFVNPLPVVDAGADQAFCGSVGTVQLIATGADSYLWSNGLTNDTISVAPLGSTTYVVTGTDLNGCSASDNVSVDVNPLPVVSAGADQSVCSGNPVLLTASGANTYVWSTGDNTASIVVSPVVATSYIVTGTDINGCMNSDTVTVNVNSAPVVSINPVAPVCAGSSVTLTANGASSYVWNNGVMTQTNTVNPTVTTTYAVIGTTNGCSAADSITVVVNYAPVADFSGTASANTYSFVNQSTGATSYSWNFGDGSPVDNGTNPSHTYTANGGYTVTLIATNSCGSDTMSMMVSVSGIGIEESDMSKTLAIFPNPTKGEFTLTFNSSSVTKANILLMSVEGRLINLDKNVSVNGAFRQTYHIENLAKGIYMLQIITDEGVITKRITLN